MLEYRARAQSGEIIIGQELAIELDNLAEDMPETLLEPMDDEENPEEKSEDNEKDVDK